MKHKTDATVPSSFQQSPSSLDEMQNFFNGPEKCTFCKSEPEITIHLFLQCSCANETISGSLELD